MKRCLSLVITLSILLINNVYAGCELTQLPSSLASLIQRDDQVGWDARNTNVGCDLSPGLFQFQSSVTDSVSNSVWHIYCTNSKGNWLHVADQTPSNGCSG
jgi:hypothetical protein